MDIFHAPEQKKFFTVLNGKEAYLSYEMPEPLVLDFQHTVVPKELSGQGIAAQLVESGLKTARKMGAKVIPTCSYVKGYFEKHPEVQDLKKS